MVYNKSFVIWEAAFEKMIDLDTEVRAFTVKIINLDSEIIVVKMIEAEGLIMGAIDVDQDDITIVQVSIVKSKIWCLKICVFLVQLIIRTSLLYLVQDYQPNWECR